MNPKNRKEASQCTVAKQGTPVAQGTPAAAVGAAPCGRPNRAGIQYGWLELVRLPNLFTVPGDVLAGVALSSPDGLFFILPVLFPVLLVSLFLYISGLILNDYVDWETDRIERPRRPLPSGRVQPKTALIIAMSLLVLALTLSFLTSQTIHENSSLFGITFEVTCGLAVLILFYNCLGRKIPLLGFTVMGLCRGANILLGASLGAKPFSAAVVTGACVEAFYIAAVSSLAHQETNGDLRGGKRWVPLVPLAGLAGLGLLLNYDMGSKPCLAQFSFLRMGIILFTFAWIFSVLWPGGGTEGLGDIGTGGRGNIGTGGRGDMGTGGQGNISSVSPSPRLPLSPSPRPPFSPSPPLPLSPSLSDGCHQVPVKIGKLIRALILIQSGLIVCGITMHKIPEQNRYVFISLAFLVVLFCFSEWTGRWFYGS